MSKMDFSLNRSPLKTVVSRKVISFSDISAMNFILGWKLLASQQERIKGTEKASPIHTYSIGNSSRVIFNTTDVSGD